MKLIAKEGGTHPTCLGPTFLIEPDLDIDHIYASNQVFAPYPAFWSSGFSDCAGVGPYKIVDGDWCALDGSDHSWGVTTFLSRPSR